MTNHIPEDVVQALLYSVVHATRALADKIDDQSTTEDLVQIAFHQAFLDARVGLGLNDRERFDSLRDTFFKIWNEQDRSS